MVKNNSSEISNTHKFYEHLFVQKMLIYKNTQHKYSYRSSDITLLYIKNKHFLILILCRFDLCTVHPWNEIFTKRYLVKYLILKVFIYRRKKIISVPFIVYRKKKLIDSIVLRLELIFHYFRYVVYCVEFFQ